MIYSDVDIVWSLAQKDGIRIDPFDEKSLQAASYDVHLADTFMFYKSAGLTHWVTDSAENLMQKVKCHGIVVAPGQFILGVTQERIRIPKNVAGRLDGKSSIGRLGLTIHSTAGNIDPGNWLNITLEIHNQSPHAIGLTAGMPIGQMVFQTLLTPTSRPYCGKYLNSTEVEASKMHLNFKNPRCLHCTITKSNEPEVPECSISPNGRHVWR